MKKNIRLAVFFGYTGDELSGMQWQRESHVKTVENELISKWFHQGFLKTERFVEIVKNFKWSRAARTDKGVHALVNGISCVFAIDEKYWDEKQDIKEQIGDGEKKEGQKQPAEETSNKRAKMVLNKEKVVSVFRSLFDCLTIYCIKEVDNKFDMRHAVKNRTYCYICPIFLFETQGAPLSQQLTLQKINRLCQYFIGTHNYHNYSKGIKAKDPSAKRYILSMSCSQISTDHLVEWPNSPIWIKFILHGQSFIYHQIRKMIGMIIQVFLHNEPEGFVENTFFNNILRIMLAPADGLYLESLRFDGYNRGDVPEKLTFEDSKEMMEQMRLKIERKIVQSQKTHSKFTQWLAKIKKGEEVKEEQVPKDIQIED